MKGIPERQAAVYHTFNVEDMIEAGHPLRAIKRMVDKALAGMSRTLKAAYSDRGRPGIPPSTSSPSTSPSPASTTPPPAAATTCPGGSNR